MMETSFCSVWEKLFVIHSVDGTAAVLVATVLSQICGLMGMGSMK